MQTVERVKCPQHAKKTSTLEKTFACPRLGPVSENAPKRFGPKMNLSHFNCSFSKADKKKKKVTAIHAYKLGDI